MSDTTGTQWDEEYDVVIVGSGGGGMAAALTAADAGLSAVIIEKGSKYGGSTAISGGGIWVPNNPTLRRKGHNDSRESIQTYLKHLTKGEVPQARIDAFIDHGPAAMELLEKSKWVKFFWTKGYADYHPEVEGGRAQGRSIEAVPFDTRKLGDLEKSQRPNNMKGPLGLWITAKDYHDLAMAKRTWAGRKASLVAAWRVSSNLVRRRHMATGGRAFAARMRMALRDAGVPIVLKTSLTDVVTGADGSVTGIVTTHRDGTVRRLRARRGVLLATGGFEQNPQMRAEYLPKGAQDNHTMGARENTGDGIMLGKKLGAAIDLMDDAWWMPSVQHPAGVPIPLLSERCIPRSVIVSSDGKRFVNESAPYVNFVHEQLAGGHVPCWFVMDHKARARYPFAQILPGAPIPKGYFEKGTAFKADTIAELAEKIGLPADALTETVAKFNEYAKAGKDPEFGRGDSAYDRYYGDPNLPNPNLDVIDSAPYYAFKMDVGDLGTKGGLVVDEHSRVLREDGSVIEGLYATGNASASVMGREYAGPGATIGPAIVFGYLAVKHAAADNAAADNAAADNAADNAAADNAAVKNATAASAAESTPEAEDAGRS